MTAKWQFGNEKDDIKKVQEIVKQCMQEGYPVNIIPNVGSTNLTLIEVKFETVDPILDERRFVESLSERPQNF